MTPEEVGAAVEARKLYVLLKATKNKRPHKILSQVIGKTVGKFYVCLYRDVGYADQDIERTHPEDYLRQFPGFIESYEATLRTQQEGSAKEWVVKSIKGKRTDLADTIEYLVDWGSNYAETWEPEDNLRHAQEHIDRYVNREPGEGRRKAPKRKAIT